MVNKVIFLIYFDLDFTICLIFINVFLIIFSILNSLTLISQFNFFNLITNLYFEQNEDKFLEYLFVNDFI